MLVLVGIALAPCALAISSAYDECGLVGYGINLYYPICANSCRDIAPISEVTCTDGSAPSPSCLAANVQYLQTVAYCISTHCSNDTDAAAREYWWASYVVKHQVGPPKRSRKYDLAVAPTPIMTYAEALASSVASPVDQALYNATYNSYYSGRYNQIADSRWSLIVTISCVLLPVALSLLDHLPIPIRASSKIRSILIDPPLVGDSRVLGIAWPSRGQAILIAYVVAINLVACSAQIISVQPQAWYADNITALVAFAARRAGIISVCNIPLLILFAGRNNFIMWFTNWSHSTCLLVHRAVAMMCALQAILHSLLCLWLYSDHTFFAEARQPYWIAGVVASLGICLMVPLAVRHLRARAYEAFLITHIAGGVMLLVGLWYHITLCFGKYYGYELWIEIAIAIWGFERVLRVLRFVKNGARHAVAYRIDDDYLRIDIPNVEATGYVFLYFPTLTWRIWENHPFSVAAFDAGPPAMDEKTDTQASNSRGISLLIRNRDGVTRRVGQRAVPIGATPVPFKVLVESSYGAQIPAQVLHDYPNLVCITGGVGITAVMPLMANRPVKLYWETRGLALVNAARDLLDTSPVWETAQIFIENRMNMEEIIESEVKVGATLVLVSGPFKMMAEARRLVTLAGQKGAVVHYIEEGFHW